MQILQHPVGPPVGAKEVGASEAVWTWRELFVHETEEVRMFKGSPHRLLTLYPKVGCHTYLRDHQQGVQSGFVCRWRRV
jgi:hypothetical protein